MPEGPRGRRREKGFVFYSAIYTNMIPKDYSAARNTVLYNCATRKCTAVAMQHLGLKISSGLSFQS